MATYEEFTIDQGSDVAIELHLENPDGSVKNLDGYSAAAKLKKTYKSSDFVEFTTTIPGMGEEGIVTIALTNQQTDSLKPGRYVYDVEISFVDEVTGNTVVDRILEGRLQVSPSVTK